MKFTTPNIVVANPIPDEIKIYYSKTDASLKLILLISALGYGIYFMATDVFVTNTIMFYLAGLFCLCIIYFIYVKIRILLSNIPRIIINNKGIETSTDSFFNWSEIKKDRVRKIGNKGQEYRLEFIIPDDKQISVRLTNLNITGPDFSILLHFYRERSQNPNFKY